MQPPFKNEYHRRKVANSSSKSCFICYKPSETVMVCTDSKSDFFYCCEQHLQDGKFATAAPDAEVEDAKREKELLEKEIASLEQQWKDKQNKKKDKKKEKKEEEKKEEEEEKEKGKSRMHELNEIINRPPRTYAMNKDIFAIRLSQYRDKQRSKQTAQMLAKPTLFPSVPTHSPTDEPSSS